MSDFVAGDSAAELLLTLFRKDGSIFDMTGKTAKLAWRIGDGSGNTLGSSTLQPMEVLSPTTDGRVRYKFISSLPLLQVDLYAAGMLYAEVHVYDGALKPISSEDVLQLTVRDIVAL